MHFGATGRIGSRGGDVVTIQAALTNAGFPVAADGIYGSATANAVKAFQREAALTADGAVGPATWDVLKAWAPKLVGPAAPASAVSRSTSKPADPVTQPALGPPSKFKLDLKDKKTQMLLVAGLGLAVYFFTGPKRG
jgi:peptidoglycan hydrolase-like protein with peptidoglycan-binding domain